MLKYIAYGFMLYRFVRNGISGLASNIEWQFLPPGFSNLRLFSGEMDVFVLVKNNNSFPTIVNGFLGTAHMASREISRIETHSDIEIPAGSAKELKLTFKEIDHDVLFALADVTGGKSRPTITIKGHAVIKGNESQYVKLPVTYAHTF